MDSETTNQMNTPPLWAVALDKMRDYYGQPLVSQVTLTAEEAYAFVEHYLATSARADAAMPIIAALAVYGEEASLPALVAKARELNEAEA